MKTLKSISLWLFLRPQILVVAGLLIALFFSSCASFPQDFILTYTGDTIEVSSIQADSPQSATGVGYNKVTKKAYLVYANGDRTDLEVVGGGFGGNTFVLILKDGTRVSVDVRTGKVTTGTGGFSK